MLARLEDRRIGYSEVIKMFQVGQAGPRPHRPPARDTSCLARMRQPMQRACYPSALTRPYSRRATLSAHVPCRLLCSIDTFPYRTVPYRLYQRSRV